MARNNNAALELNVGENSASESSAEIMGSPDYSPTGSPLPNIDGEPMDAGDISSSAPSSTTDEEPGTPNYSPPTTPHLVINEQFIQALCTSREGDFPNYTNAETLGYRPCVFQKLSDVGYHRARVSVISDYDKAIGGLSWLISRFEKRDKRPSKSWSAQDGFRETGSQPKTNSERKKEVEAIIRGLVSLNCDVMIHMATLMVVDFFVINRLLAFLIPKFNSLDGTVSLFKCYQLIVTSSLQEEDEDADRTTPTLLTMYRRVLYLPNKIRHSQAKHCDMFDYSIVLDKKVTPRQILAEYITYSRTGVRTYPQVFDKLLHEDLTLDQTDPFDLTPNVYQVLEELANNIFESYNEDALDALDTAMRSLRVHSFGSRLRIMHMRCVEEFHKLNAVQKSYDELSAVYERTQVKHYDLTPFMVSANMGNLVNQTRERGSKVSEMLISDYEDAHNRIEIIQARGYCPFGREECDKLREGAETTFTRLSDLRRRYKRMEHDLNQFELALKEFNSAHEKPIGKYVPMKETFVDEVTCGELGLWAERVQDSVDRVKTNELAFEDPLVEELRDQYVALLTDARICIKDLERKAYLLRKRRYQMSEKLEKLHGQLFTEQLKAIAYDKIVENLHKLNVGLPEYRERVTEAENGSPSFAANAIPPPRPAQ